MEENLKKLVMIPKIEKSLKLPNCSSAEEIPFQFQISSYNIEISLTTCSRISIYLLMSAWTEMH